MKNVVRILCGLLLAFTVIFTTRTESAFAYTLDDLGDYIENPGWFDNQEGRADDAIGTERVATGSEPSRNTRIIYFNKTHKTYQLLVRQYDETKGIDIDNDDLTWSVVDERICTVDGNGFVKAGEMTGATTILAEGPDYILEFTVINLTGNYDEWYEEMFTNVWVASDLTEHYVKNYTSMGAMRRDTKYVGIGYKVIVDAYLQYGNRLYDDPEIRLEVIKEAVNEALKYAGGVSNLDYANCVSNAKITSQILNVFNNSTNQKCAEGTYAFNGHITNTLLLDGIVYNVNDGIFKQKCVETDGEWKSDHMFYCEYIYNNHYGTVKSTLSATKTGDWTHDRSYITNKLKTK